MSIDSLANNDNHVPENLRRHFEAIIQLDSDEQAAIRTRIDSTPPATKPADSPADRQDPEARQSPDAENTTARSE